MRRSVLEISWGSRKPPNSLGEKKQPSCVHNPGFHVGHNTAQIVSDWLRGTGAYLVFTLVYTPDFNAAELIFSYLKMMTNLRILVYKIWHCKTYSGVKSKWTTNMSFHVQNHMYQYLL